MRTTTSGFVTRHKAAIGALLFLGGCSLVNTFDTLKGKPVTGTGGTGGTDASAGGGGAGTGGGGTGGAGSGGGPKDVNTDVLVDLTDLDGVIVTYESNTTTTPPISRVWVLDAKDGSEISKEDTPNELLIAHDYQDQNWYFFEQGATTTEASLRVRRLYKGGLWVDQGPPVAVPVPAKSLGILAGRVAYLSTPNTTAFDPANYTLTVLDTSNPAAVAVATGTATHIALPAGQKQDSVASPSSTGVGGTVTVVVQDPSTANVNLLRVLVSTTGVTVDTTSTNIGAVDISGGQMGFTANINAGHVVGILPPSAVPTANLEGICDITPTGEVAIANSFSPAATHSVIVASPTFAFESRRVQGTTYDHCHDVAFASTLLNDFALWAIPMTTTGTPTVSKLCLGEGTSGLLYDSFNNRVLRISTSGALEAYDVNATAPSSPTVTKNNSFALPTGLSLASGVLDIRRLKPCP